MPRMSGSRRNRRGGKPYRKIRRNRLKRRNAVKRLNSSAQGYININCRLPHISCQALAFAGGVGTTDPTGTCLTLGTPTQVPGTIAAQNLYDVPFSLSFDLAQLTSYTEFTTLFDYYKINGVKVQLKVFPNSNTATGVGLPWLEFWSDHDDSVPQTALQAREHMGTKSRFFTGDKMMTTMYVKPTPLADLAGAASAIMPNKWINCANSSIPHYGIKGIIHNYYLSGSTGQNQVVFDVMSNVSFKGVQ